MPKIYVAKRVIDYQGLLARGIPESTLAIDETMAPVLALMQGMGADGAKLVNVDANGNLQVASDTATPYESVYSSSTPMYPLLFKDDMEGGMQWSAAGGGTVTKVAGGHNGSANTNQVATTAANGNQTTAAANFAPHLDRIRWGIWFFFAAALIGNMQFQLSRVDGARYVDIIVRYDAATGVWSYKSSDAPLTFTPFTTLKLLDLAWHYLEVQASFQQALFEYIRIGGRKYAPNVFGTQGASPTLASTQLVVILTNNSAAVATLNFDDVTVVGLDA